MLLAFFCALGSKYIFSFSLFFILTNVLRFLSVFFFEGGRKVRVVATTKTGLNDAAGVVWALLGAFFFLRFFDTNLCFYFVSRFYLGMKNRWRR